MNKKVRKVVFYMCLFIMGAFVIETDIITGHPHHHLCDAVNWYEEPKEKETDGDS